MLDYDSQTLALAQFMGTDPINIEHEYGDVYSHHGREYLVIDDDDAERRLTEYARNLADETLREVPSNLRQYFDEKAYVADLEGDIDRGSALAGYDGVEEEETLTYDSILRMLAEEAGAPFEMLPEDEKAEIEYLARNYGGDTWFIYRQ